MRSITEEEADRLGSFLVLVLSLIFITGIVLELTGIIPQARKPGALLIGILLTIAAGVALLLVTLS